MALIECLAASDKPGVGLHSGGLIAASVSPAPSPVMPFSRSWTTVNVQSAVAIGFAAMAISLLALPICAEAQSASSGLKGEKSVGGTESYQTTSEVPSCKTKGMLEKLSGFAAARDPEAYQKYLLERLKEHDCELLPKGIKVFVEEVNLFSFPCVRVRGDTSCRYVSRAWIERSTAPISDAPTKSVTPTAR